MKTKEEIYLRVRTQQKADKLKKVLKMFNQPVYSKHSIDNCVNSTVDLVIHYDGEEWLNICLSEEELEDKTKVKIKELKNILAVENLKEGDVIILEGGEEKYKWVVEVNRAEESENFPICVHPKNYVGLDGVEKYDEDTTAISGQFVRFATKAEKELMNGQKVAAPTEPLVKIGNWYWFEHPEFEKRALVYVNDISESCNGNFGFNYEHEWMTGKGDDSFGAHYALEDGCLYEETTIIKATDEEVEAMLIEEAERRGFKIGCKFLGCLGADSIRQLELNKFELGHKGDKIKGLFCGNSWITFEGEWGKVVEEEEPKEEKKELVVGKWYKYSWDYEPEDIRGLYFVEKLEGVKVWFSYGIDFYENEFISNKDWYNKDHVWQEATTEEVKQSLVKEAKRRGLLTVGATIGNTENENQMEVEDNFTISFIKGELTLDWPSESWTIFNKGRWAKVVVEQKSGDNSDDDIEEEPKVGDVVEVVICGAPYAFITVIQKIHKSPHEHEENPYFINGWSVEGKPRILKTDSEIIAALKPF